VAVKIFSEIAHWTAKRLEAGFLTDVRITNRERDIIRLVSEGLTNKEIAQQLGIATETAKSHVHRIMEKLGVRRRIELARLEFHHPSLA
jgi:RNA polymerase sigma factor (sigma-70 family)